MQRRFILSALLAATAAPALAQGKKSSGNSTPTPPPSGDVINIQGTYDAYGRNPDGSDYENPVEIIQKGTAVDFAWINKDNTTRGTGTIEGRVITVDWGDATPVVYVAMENGNLHGTWADGLGLEKLTKR